MNITRRLTHLELAATPHSEHYSHLSDAALDQKIATELERLAGHVPGIPSHLGSTERLHHALDLLGIPRCGDAIDCRLTQLLAGRRP